MREAIGGAYIFQIVVVFILLFTGFMSLSINYSRAFSVSSEIANILEKHNGYTTDAKKEIEEYIIEVGYRTKSDCEKNGDAEVHYKGYNEKGDETDIKKATYCLRKVAISGSNNEFPESAYYRIKVFFKLDLPMFGNFFGFEIKNSTRKLYHPVG